MNKRQKSLLINGLAVITLTFITVSALINFKDWTNRSESIKAMEHLSRIVFQYRKSRGAVPPETYVNGIKAELEGNPQLGKINYRARWIHFDSKPDEILAYVEKKYNSLLFSPGYVVLRLDGRVEWIGKEEFDIILPESERQKEFELPYEGSESILPPRF